MRKVVMGDSTVFQAVTLEQFCKINSQETDHYDLSGEGLFENLFDMVENISLPNNQYLLMLVDKNDIFEYYEDTIFNQQIEDDGIEEATSDFFHPPDETTLQEEEYWGEIYFPKNASRGKKSHHFFSRTQTFRKKINMKKKIRASRKRRNEEKFFLCF